MATDIQTTAECPDCGHALPLSRKGECPSCGSERRKINVVAHDTLNVSIRERISWEKTREYFENHPRSLAAAIALTVGPPFVGLFVAGPAGVAIGLVLGVVCLLVGFGVRTKVREIERGGDR